MRARRWERVLVWKLTLMGDLCASWDWDFRKALDGGFEINLCHRQIHKTVFPIQIFVPLHNFLECMKSSVSIGEYLHTPIQRHILLFFFISFVCLCIGVASVLTNTNTTFRAI
jgi:hypothetical protein